MSIAPVEPSGSIGGGESKNDVLLLSRFRRVLRRESRRARSCCLLSSLCSGFRCMCGGLEVTDRVEVARMGLSVRWLLIDSVSRFEILSDECVDSRGPALWSQSLNMEIPKDGPKLTRPCEVGTRTQRESRVKGHCDGTGFSQRVLLKNGC